MGDRKELSVASSFSSRKNNYNGGDGRKQKADSDSDSTISVSLPEGWEIRHSRSRNGKIFYVNTITKVSTWKRPNEDSKDQARLAIEAGAQLKSRRKHQGTEQPNISAVTQLKEKQLLPDLTASVYSNKRKAEQKASAGPPSNKVQKSSAVSTVQIESLWQKYQRNKAHIENNEKPITKHSLEKQQTTGSCNSGRTKNQHVFNSKATKEVFTSQGEHATSQTDKTLIRQILKPNRKTSKLDCSQSFYKNSGAAGEVKSTVPLNSNSTCSKNAVISALNPVPFTLRGTSCNNNKSQNTNAGLLIPSHLRTTNKPATELVTSSDKQNKRSRPLQLNRGSLKSDESYYQVTAGTKQSRQSQLLQYSSGSDNGEESYHQGTSDAKQCRRSQPLQYNAGSHNSEKSYYQVTAGTKQSRQSHPLQYSSSSDNGEESYHQGTSDAKQNRRSQPLQYNAGSHNSEESYYQETSGTKQSRQSQPVQYSSSSDNGEESYHQRTSDAKPSRRSQPLQYSSGSHNSEKSYYQETSGTKQSRQSQPLEYSSGSHNDEESYHQGTSDAKPSRRSQPLQCNSDSYNSEESYHEETSRHLNKTNMGLTPQTNLAQATHSHSFSCSPSQTCHSEIKDHPKSLTHRKMKISDKLISRSLNDATCADNSLFKSPYEARLHSPDSTNWKTAGHMAGSFLDSQSGRCNAADNISVSNGSALWSPSPSGTEEEQDIEDMEIDEGLAILSNLQDVRTQASSMLHEPKGELTETLTQAKPLDESPALGSTRDVLKKQVILVVDTNVFISCLKFLQDIMNRTIPGYDGIILVMPWVVMQELDYLKSNKRSSINNLSLSTAQRAAKAIRFIHSHIIEKNSQLIGQTPQEAAEKTDLPLESNDDRILQCCLQFEQKYPGSLVVLLTRDMNLVNKAVIMGITAANNETLLARLRIPKLQPGDRQVSSTTGSPNTRKRTLQNNEVESTGTKYSNGVKTVLKTDTTPVRETDTRAGVHKTPSSTPLRPVPHKKANLSLPDKIPLVDTPTTAKVKPEVRRLPQTDTEKAAVMGKFEAVWKLIHDMKSQIGEILAVGKSHANYGEAVELLKRLKPLLLALNDDFGRCLYLSPVIIWEHEADFAALCTRLNTFYAEAQDSCVDPSQQIQPVDLQKHFSDTSNRSVLFSGLEQLSVFITDVETMLKTCS